MRRLLLLLVLLSALPLFARGRGVSISIDDDDDVIDCSDVSVRLDGEAVPVIAEDIPFSGRALRLRSEENGGIRVIGWNNSGYQVRACKAVAPGMDLGSIRVTARGDEVSASGPDEQRWVVYYIVRAPRGAVLDLRSTNGPISVMSVDGTITAEAINGPVSVKDSAGTIDARTTNGPISFGGSSGTVKLLATNGPIAVKLAGMGWNGGSLDASTQNGPLTLKLPRGYQSGVLVESLGHGPVVCRAAGCDGRRTYRDADDDMPRRIELGAGPRMIRVATTNGPVSVKESD